MARLNYTRSLIRTLAPSYTHARMHARTLTHSLTQVDVVINVTVKTSQNPLEKCANLKKIVRVLIWSRLVGVAHSWIDQRSYCNEDCGQV